MLIMAAASKLCRQICELENKCAAVMISFAAASIFKCALHIEACGRGGQHSPPLRN